MGYLRTKKIEFNSLDGRANRNDTAEIHGISMGEFIAIQNLLQSNENATSYTNISDANVEMITKSCHKLKVSGKEIEVTRDNILELDALYFNLLLGEVMSFHEFGETTKN